jgi:hypothetical protein
MPDETTNKKDAEQDSKLAVLEAKVEHMIGHVAELTERVRKTEKWIAGAAAVIAVATAVIGFVLAADAKPVNAKEDERLLIYHEMVENIRQYNLERDATLPADSINKALQEINYGRNGSAEQEELLQFSCDGGSESLRRGYYRCDN